MSVTPAARWTVYCWRSKPVSLCIELYWLEYCFPRYSCIRTIALGRHMSLTDLDWPTDWDVLSPAVVSEGPTWGTSTGGNIGVIASGTFMHWKRIICSFCNCVWYRKCAAIVICDSISANFLTTWTSCANPSWEFTSNLYSPICPLTVSEAMGIGEGGGDGGCGGIKQGFGGIKGGGPLLLFEVMAVTVLRYHTVCSQTLLVNQWSSFHCMSVS